MKILNFKRYIYILFVLLLSACSVQEQLIPLTSVQGDVILKNGSVKKGEITILEPDQVYVNDSVVESLDIKQIQFYNKNVPENKYLLEYMPLNKRIKLWVAKMSQGKYLSSYIGASTYKVNNDGRLVIKGQSVPNTIDGNFTYPVFMIKNNADKLRKIGFHKGVVKEDIRFRVGISKYLKDDPKLCEYINYKKLGFDDLELITRNYVPNRQGQLTIDGKNIGKIKSSLFTYDFDYNWLYSFELGFPNSKYYGTQYSLETRFFKKRFFSFGFSVSWAPLKGVNKNPFLEESLFESSFLTIRSYLGGSLPMNINNKFYIIPGLHVFAGLRSDFSWLFGPMANVDFGFKLSHVGNVLFVGTGFRYNKNVPFFFDPLPDSYPVSKSFGTAFVRLSYKF